jgi:hypothetical protein
MCINITVHIAKYSDIFYSAYLIGYQERGSYFAHIYMAIEKKEQDNKINPII